MKKNIFALVALLVIATISFTSCKPDEVSNPNNILAENMISLLDIAGIQVVLDNNGKTIDISIPFEAKDSIAKITVLFNDLPSGAMVTPLNTVKDFSNNQRQNYTVTFQDGEVKVYSVGITYSALQPKFSTIKLNGVTAVLENGIYIAQLLASEDLKVVKIAYLTNEPTVTVKIKNTDNDDYVALDTLSTSATAKYNFEDKANGRKLKLEYNGVTNIVTVKVRTSGYTKITKVWQTFANFGTPDFYGVTQLAGTSPATIVPAAPGTDAWDRGIAMDDNYIYIARGNKHIQAETGSPAIYPAYGIIAVKISDKSAKLMNRTGMYTVDETGRGAHGTTDVNIIGGKIVACNLANGASNILKVFVWDNVDAAPSLLFSYNVGVAPNPRLGDKFTFEGDLTNGKLRFFDYNANNRYYEFTIAGGVVNTTPTIVTVPGILSPSTGSTAGAIYKFSPTEYMFSGTGKQAVVFNPTTQVVTYATSSAVFPASEVGDAFFKFNDKTYLAYIFQKNTGFNWALRIRPLDYSTLAESLEKISVKSLDFNLSGLAADDMSLVSNGNSTGKVYVHTTAGGITYILALASNQGFGLFKVE
jgi:hypothetical protein